MREAFLTKPQQKLLIRYLAGAGENYQKYSEFCDQFGLKKFTPHYLRRWIHNHREVIQLEREKVKMEVNQASKHDRERRISDLEKDIERIEMALITVDKANHVCRDCGEPHNPEVDVMLKLMEQKRKLSQAIAQERGEWNKEEKATDQAPVSWKITAIERIQDDTSLIVEGEVREIAAPSV